MKKKWKKQKLVMIVWARAKLLNFLRSRSRVGKKLRSRSRSPLDERTLGAALTKALDLVFYAQCGNRWAFIISDKIYTECLFKKSLYYLFYIPVPRSCYEYGRLSDSGYYTINPLKEMGGKSKMKVQCDFEHGKSRKVLNYSLFRIWKK